ncbi:MULTISPECIES: phospholipase D family protein [Enterobacter]|uniref:phospholipase D family protein n=1 Tax=Enterobacter TaxID=547 RepID=UPI0018885E02|nr:MULTISPECIES: phospholipase D family protein [Enterobacter]MBF2803459.1 phospholipase D family protein [Enterobacter bugandensis]MDS1915918.1 phospholipase D family protein [Enterobacter asburiae]MDX7664945.1 phospholipase D family protein [Enterobacter asburiae]
MELMNQPFTGQLGNRLIALLDSPDYHTLNIVVAFAKNSGVLRIKDSLERFRKRGGIVNAYLGVDLGGTSYEALTALLLHTDSLNIIHSEKAQTFHAKIYQFLGDNNGLIVVGSHNLTGGGLWTNFESSVHIAIDRVNENEGEILSGLENYIGELTSLGNSFMPITSQDDIETLLQNGYIFKEVTERIRLAAPANKDRAQARLFGNGAPAPLPGVGMSQVEQSTAVIVAPPEPVSAPLSGEGQTIWFETGRMTGGSRNILDLSKKSLVEHGDPSGTPFDLGNSKFMRGGVEFFGLDPAVTALSKDITLNFEGVDYFANTILFPDGSSANGTWRLQIKGTSASGRRITDAFRAKGEAEYLVRKIITFTKIQGDYFFMSVFAASELENFKAASHILARNGATTSARQLGLL